MRSRVPGVTVQASDKSVLIVEDNDDNRAIYSLMLARNGYRVLEAADGATALQVIDAERPELVLLDISIPRVSGWDVAEMVKHRQDTRSILLVALTAHAYEDDRARAASIGFADYLVKPIGPREVLQCVVRMIGVPGAGAELQDP